VPPRRNRKVQYTYDAALYKHRNIVERSINRLKDWRRIATRFDKLTRNFVAAFDLFAACPWLRY